MTTSVPRDVSKERDLLIFVYEAFNRRDLDSILNVLHPEVEWPNGMEGGWVQGHEGVRSYWTRQWGMMDPHVDAVRLEADNDGHIIVDVHQRVRDLAGTVLLDRMVQHVYLIQDGLIRRMDIRE
jgi:SnoaL-like domain